MQQADLASRIERAKELLSTVRHAAVATTNEDGSPHNSPVFAGFNDEFQMLWASHPRAMHSQNIARTGQVFIVLFDSLDQGGGLYIQAEAELVGDGDIIQALADFNVARQRHLREIIPPEQVMSGAQQRLYRATPVKFWVNMAERSAAGYVVRDNRYEVTAADLQS